MKNSVDNIWCRNFQFMKKKNIFNIFFRSIQIVKETWLYFFDIFFCDTSKSYAFSVTFEQLSYSDTTFAVTASWSSTFFFKKLFQSFYFPLRHRLRKTLPISNVYLTEIDREWEEQTLFGQPKISLWTINIFKIYTKIIGEWTLYVQLIITV